MSRLSKSFKWAGQGVWYCLRREKNFRIHCALAVITITAATLLNVSPFEWMIITICIITVMAFEMANTAIEHLCNIAHPGISPLVKLIKDVMAGAVLLVAIMAVICGAVIFIPKILSFI